MKIIKNSIKSALKALGVGIVSCSEIEKIEKNTRSRDDIEMLLTLPKEHAGKIVEYLTRSHSQLRQDLFVLSELNFKKNGFFVEFGAADGVLLSNTLLMEKEFGWRGILAEPAKCWHEELGSNRSSIIDHNCVWKDSQSTLLFNEVERPELSTIDSYSNFDLHKKARKSGKGYEVPTISLNDLLRKYHAPKKIDYLSIDTEGSEFEILSHFDFSEYSFEVITCEHNFTPLREKLFDLLSKNGYKRKYQKISKFDDWYVKVD